jgi:hypothetical protein
MKLTMLKFRIIGELEPTKKKNKECYKHSFIKYKTKLLKFCDENCYEPSRVFSNLLPILRNLQKKSE